MTSKVVDIRNGQGIATSVEEHWDKVLDIALLGPAGDAVHGGLAVYGNSGTDFRYGLEFHTSSADCAVLCTRYAVFTAATEEALGEDTGVMGSVIERPRLIPMISIDYCADKCPIVFEAMPFPAFSHTYGSILNEMDGLGGLDITTDDRPGFAMIPFMMAAVGYGKMYEVNKPYHDKAQGNMVFILHREGRYTVFTFHLKTTLEEHYKWTAALKKAREEQCPPNP